MNDETAFLDAIRATPDDDTPRLVFADWLQENDQEARAEFIRVQVRQHLIESAQGSARYWAELRKAHARCALIHQKGCSVWCATHVRIHELLHADVPHPGGLLWSQWEAWLGLDRVQAPSGYKWFHRGFVDSVTCPAADWLTHADAILREHPVTRVRLTALAQGLLLGRSLLVQREGGVNEWRAIICSPDEGAGNDRWPGITFELPSH